MEGEPTGTRGPGFRLREAREARRMSQADAARALRLEQKYIAALENDDYAALPAPIFTRGYLSAYCKLLGIPADECLADYERVTGGNAPPPLVLRRATGDEISSSSSPVVLVTWIVALLAVAMVVLWYLSRPEPVPAPVVVAPQTTPAPTPAPTPAVEPEDDVDTEAEERLPVPVAAPPVIRDEPPPAVVTRAVRIEYREESWTEITDATGRRLYFDLARAGQVVEVSGEPPLAVFLGNAPGVRITVDGRPFDHARFVRAGNVARFTIGAS